MEIQIFTESLIKKAKLSGRYSTADSYLSTLHRLQLFTNAPDMHFDKITPELIKAFEQHLFQKGLFDNTVSLYMRMLRSIFNQAVTAGVATLNTKEIFENAGNSICRFSLFTQKQRKWKHINLSSPKNGTTTVYHHRKVCCQNYKTLRM